MLFRSGIVAFWAERAEPLDSVISDHIRDSLTVLDTLVTLNGARGRTVGVVPLPQDASPAALADRLAGLIDQSCELGWIDDRSTCAQLRVHANTTAASMHALLDRLESNPGKHISRAADLLLKENVRALLARL